MILDFGIKMIGHVSLAKLDKKNLTTYNTLLKSTPFILKYTNTVDSKH